MKNPPFRRVARSLQCSNSRFDIYFDTLEDAQGNSVDKYLVVTPSIKTKDDVTGVAVLPVSDGHYGLVHIYRQPIESYRWEVPRGFVGANESHKESAKRELHEEVGISIDEDDLEDLGVVSPEPGIITAMTKIYTAKISSRNNRRCHGHREIGHVDFRWFNDDEIVELIDTNKVCDATTLLLLSNFKSKLSGARRKRTHD